MKAFTGLYAITPENLAGESLYLRAQQAIEGGASVLQYRKKNLSEKQMLEEALRLAELCRQQQVTFIINDHYLLAKKVGAQGVHLGIDDEHLEPAREHLGASAIIGISCYDNLERAIEAEHQGANYVAFGRFFPSRSKPLATTAPLALLEKAKAKLRIPIVAIGGIQPEHAPLLFSKGADMIAVIDGLFGQPNPKQAAFNYLASTSAKGSV